MLLITTTQIFFSLSLSSTPFYLLSFIFLYSSSVTLCPLKNVTPTLTIGAASLQGMYIPYSIAFEKLP
jgi:hypothetical protein